jgi:hypothetical protein
MNGVLLAGPRKQGMDSVWCCAVSAVPTWTFVPDFEAGALAWSENGVK